LAHPVAEKDAAAAAVAAARPIFNSHRKYDKSV